MKLNLKFAGFILLLNVIFFVGCSKEKNITTSSINNPPPPPPPPPTDTLSGKEFIFTDLIWEFDNDGGAELYIGIENRPDLFSVEKSVKVSVKSVIDSNWIAAEKIHFPNSPGYVFGIDINAKSLFVFPSPYIFPWSGNTQLPGTKVSLKVKF
jgi:hypothetical protein